MRIRTGDGTLDGSAATGNTGMGVLVGISRDGSARIGRFERAFVVEMDVGNQRNLRRAGDFAKCGSAVFIGA